MIDQITVYNLDASISTILLPLPSTLTTSINAPLVSETFRRVNMDTRQPYAVSPLAGMQHSAVGWGTGRAVARVPRIRGSGTRRAGQGAFANFCRKGRPAHPTKVTRRWHRKVNMKEKMHAVAMAYAATANANLVEARGHVVCDLPSIPIVIDNSVVELKKTKDAMAVLSRLGLKGEVEKVKDSRGIRAGQGKWRNTPVNTQKRGILVIKCESDAEMKAFRNIPGVEFMDVEKPDLVKLAPGGHVGRLVLWTQGAFEKLDVVMEKMRYVPVEGLVKNDDLEAVFLSAEVQALAEEMVYTGENVKMKHPKEILAMNPYLELTAE